MDEIEIFKALSNKTRIQILTWLKEPSKHFPVHKTNCENNGVCVGLIQQKAGLTSRISYCNKIRAMDLLQKK